MFIKLGLVNLNTDSITFFEKKEPIKPDGKVTYKVNFIGGASVKLSHQDYLRLLNNV